MSITAEIIAYAKGVLALKHMVSETDLDYIGQMAHLLLFNVMDSAAPNYQSTIAFSMKEQLSS